MKKLIMPIAALALVAYAGTASAQCDFDTVKKSKGLKSSMIRSFAACPSTENPTSNTKTSGGTPACEPVTPRETAGGGTLYNFSTTGTCDIQTKGSIVKDCSTLTAADGITLLGMPPGPCHVVKVKGKCKGILQDDQATPINATDDSGWSLATLSRASLNDGNSELVCNGGTEDGDDCTLSPTACTTGGGTCDAAGNGDMTVIDFPVTFDFNAPNNGQIQLQANSAQVLSDLVGPSAAALPTCTQIQIVDITVKDPDGLAFASLGGGTAP